MTNAHLNSHQYLKSEMLTSQKDGNDDDNAEKNKTKTTNLDDVWPKQKPLTWMMFGPCRRGIPHIQQTVFSSITH